MGKLNHRPSTIIQYHAILEVCLPRAWPARRRRRSGAAGQRTERAGRAGATKFSVCCQGLPAFRGIEARIIRQFAGNILCAVEISENSWDRKQGEFKEKTGEFDDLWRAWFPVSRQSLNRGSPVRNAAVICGQVASSSPELWPPPPGRRRSDAKA